MARIRAVKPEFWSSPDTAALPDPWARLLFIAMWNWADDYGRGTANPKELAGFAFPNDESISSVDIRRMLGGIHRAFGVVFYKVDGRPYYAIPSWEVHQKIDKRSAKRCPPPEGAPLWDPEPPDQPEQNGSHSDSAGTRRGLGGNEVVTACTSNLVSDSSGDCQESDFEADLHRDHGAPVHDLFGDSAVTADLREQQSSVGLGGDSAGTRRGPGAGSRNVEVGSRKEVKSITSKIAPRSRRSSDPRPDVDQLCERLHNKITANGSEATVGKAWQDAARLLLDRDHRPLSEALRLIEWCQEHSFWHTNILSMPTFRKQYDKLRLQEQTENGRRYLKAVPGGYRPYTNPTDPSVYHQGFQ